MVLTRKELKIFEIFTKHPFVELTYRQIKAKNKSNNQVQSAIKKFKKENIIIQKFFNNLKTYSANHDNPATHAYFNLIFLPKIPKHIRKTLGQLDKELSKHTELYSLIIFGSYVNKKYTQKSDLDIAIITDKNVEPALKRMELISLIEIDGHVIKDKEMTQMLKNKEPNLGKAIALNHLPIKNSGIFYKLINNVIKEGIRLQTLSSEI